MGLFDKDNEYPDGVVTGRFFKAVDRAASVQAPAIRSYVERVKSKHPDKSAAELQEVLDGQFKKVTVGSGAGTGGLAAMPGIGTLVSLAGIAGESVLILELCGFYTLASAELKGIDISSEAHRRALVLAAVSGLSGNELISALTAEGSLKSITSLRGIKGASSRDLKVVNSALGRIAMKQVRKRFRGALVRKVMPFGIGALLGARENAKISDALVKQVRELLDELN